MRETARIADIADLNPRVPREIAAAPDRMANFVPMSHLSERGVISCKGTRAVRDILKGYTYFANGDVIVAKITPCMENGKAALVCGLSCGIGFGSTEFHVLRPREGIEPRYLFYMLWNPIFRRAASRNMTGTAGQKRVPSSFIENFRVPLPPHGEQKRIVEILDRAYTLCQKGHAAESQLDKLGPALFCEMFGDPIHNPKRWPLDKVGGHVTLLQYGPRFFNEKYTPTGVRIVRITDLDFQGNLDYPAMPTLEVGDDDRERFRLVAGDLLLARTGATVGKTTLISDDAPECIAGAYFIRLRFDDAVLPLYAQMLLRTAPLQRIIAERSQQSAQQNFNGPAVLVQREMEFLVALASELK